MRRTMLVLAAALAACSTETHERGLMGQWGRGDASRSRDPAPQQEAAPEPPRGTVIEIPGDVAAQMNEFLDRKSTLFADAIEIELSPKEFWLGRSTFAVAPDAVNREDHEDATQGLLTISLSRAPGVPATSDAVPTVRFGDGLRVVGVDRIVLRFASKRSADRPIWMHAVGGGKTALYAVEGDRPQQWRGTTVDVRSEIRRADGTYRFDSSAEAKP